MLPLSSKETILGVTTITPKDKELHACPHVTCPLAHQWDPHNVCFPKCSCTVEEDISRNIGTVIMEGGSPDLTNTDSDSNSVDQSYDIGSMTSRMIGSVKVASIPSRDLSETKAAVQNAPQAKTIQSKGRHSTVPPEEPSEW